MKKLIPGLIVLFALNLNGQKMNTIQEKINTLFIATDQSNWEIVEQCFSQKVTLDYSSMTGQPASELTTKQIVESWKTILPGFDYTHHQLGNFIIQADNNTATVFCYGTATHFIESATDQTWTVVGSYDFDLVKKNSSWKISKMKFNFKYQSGNLKLPQLAISRATSQEPALSISEKNKKTVRQFFTALEEENVDNIVKLFAKNAKHINPYHSEIFPRGANGNEAIREYWTPVFPNFDGMEFPIEEIYAMEDPAIIYVKYKGVIKLKNNAGYYKNDYYSTFKFNDSGKIIEYVEIFNPITAAKGFGLLDKIKKDQNKLNRMEKVTFKSEGLNLIGNLFYPPNFQEGQSYPAIIVSGSWTTVKEQMAGLYAQKLAEKGFITLAFDFRNFGESEGEPRFYESPSLKKEDIKNAVNYLENLDQVNKDQIGAFGVCAGSMYTLMAASEDSRIKSVVTAASWLHDAEAVKLFYGGDEGVNSKIEAAQKAKSNYAENGAVEYIPTISTEDKSAAMFGPYDYYLNPDRGAIKEWSADKFAVMSWEDWLTTDPMPTAKNLDCPTLMIHSDGAVLPQYTKNYFEQIASDDKKLHWMNTDLDSPFHQFNYYDQEEEVNESINEAAKWFFEKM